jgi:hypothetical protein
LRRPRGVVRAGCRMQARAPQAHKGRSLGEYIMKRLHVHLAKHGWRMKSKLAVAFRRPRRMPLVDARV